MNLVIATVAMVTLLSSMPSSSASLCDLAGVRQSASSQLIGRWMVTNKEESSIVSLMQSAVNKAKTASNTPVPLTQHRDVIEAYSQLVNGMNFCIRFSASGNCGNYYCKSYECTASGHRSRGSEEINDVEVDCQTFTECNIEVIRENSKKPMPGGWYTVSLDDEQVRKLHEASSRLATIEHGTVVEAYRQTVRGSNYCIQFKGQSSGNCGNNCKPLSCVAGGFYPLPSENVNSELTTRVGVNCLPHDHSSSGKFGSSGDSSSGAHLSATILTTIIIAVFISVSLA